MSETFQPLLEGGRIVSVGSGAGPMYMKQASEDVVKRLCDATTFTTNEAATAIIAELSPAFNPF